MQLNLIEKLYFDSTNTIYDVDISYLNFDEPDHYEAWVLCGEAVIPCDDPSASPPITVKSATTLRVITQAHAPVKVGIFAFGKNVGRDPV